MFGRKYSAHTGRHWYYSDALAAAVALPVLGNYEFYAEDNEVLKQEESAIARTLGNKVILYKVVLYCKGREKIHTINRQRILIKWKPYSGLVNFPKTCHTHVCRYLFKYGSKTHIL